MHRCMVLFCTVILAVSLLHAAGGTEISFGYQFTSSEAAIAMAHAFGLPATNTNELMIDIHPYAVSGDYLRLGGLFSGGFFRTTGEPAPDILLVDRASVNFGDARLAFIPEVYRRLEQFDVAFGLAIGGGAIIPFMQDGVGDNDEDFTLYLFLRPQLTGAYNMGSVSFRIGTGYHLPIAGADGEFWSVSAAGDTMSYPYTPTEIRGFFVKAGFVFGSLSSNRRR